MSSECEVYCECEMSCDREMYVSESWSIACLAACECSEVAAYEASQPPGAYVGWEWMSLGQWSGGGPVWLVCEATLADADVRGVAASCAHGATADDAVEGREHQLELADILRRYGASPGAISWHERRTISAIARCRTRAIGTHRRVCETCWYTEEAPNSCRNRHCPKCQGLDEARWLDRQMEDVLPVRYHHGVFTVPQDLHLFFRVAPAVAYGKLFSAAAETLLEVALRPSNLGAKIGFTAILHTWNQRLGHHVHLHFIVPGGGLSGDGKRWVQAKPKFLFSVAVLMRVFRGKLLRALELASESGEIPVPRKETRKALRRAAHKRWEVYSKPALGGPERVLGYLGRYTHRIAISNSRLVALANDQVTFRWRDRTDGNRVKLMTLDAVEFCRRFLQHIVPPGFHRIRHYGLLSNNARREAVALCRERLGEAPPPRRGPAGEPWWELYRRVTGRQLPSCPRCGAAPLVHEEVFLAPDRRRWATQALRSPPQAA